jgi:hypothetical protein
MTLAKQTRRLSWPCPWPSIAHQLTQSYQALLAVSSKVFKEDDVGSEASAREQGNLPHALLMAEAQALVAIWRRAFCSISRTDDQPFK